MAIASAVPATVVNDASLHIVGERNLKEALAALKQARWESSQVGKGWSVTVSIDDAALVRELVGTLQKQGKLSADAPLSAIEGENYKLTISNADLQQIRKLSADNLSL